MKNIKDLINMLTENNTYALNICEYLYKNNHYQTLCSLKKLKITGEKLEKLFNLCGYEYPYIYLIETVKYLSSGYIDKLSILDNLTSDTPIPFITRLPNENESVDTLYNQYTTKFYKNFRATKDKFKRK